MAKLLRSALLLVVLKLRQLMLDRDRAIHGKNSQVMMMMMVMLLTNIVISGKAACFTRGCDVVSKPFAFNL